MSNPIENAKQVYPNIPKGYKCSDKGVQQLADDSDPVWITFKPVLVKALSRDESGSNWGVLVWWIDLDGRGHEVAIPKKLFHAQGTELAQQLADGGLQIVPGREKALLRYLAAFNVKNKLMAASCTGWLKESFVLPSETINEPEDQRVVYQPSGLSSTSRAIRKTGSFQGWKDGMGDASPMIQFFVCAALSAPVRFKVGIEAGGFHAYNLTSHGKTTMVQAASSVWGNGVDPAIAGGDEAYIQRWNATANALEAKAETFNDLPLIIDEIGEGDPREFGKTIYRIISGTGRSRSDRSGGLRDSKSWRVTVLSAGEVAVSDFIESGGNRVKGGQMVRMIDLDLAAIGSLFDSSNQADTMKKLCAENYGHAGPKMLEGIPDLASDWKGFDYSSIGEASTPIASRVLKRFALVAYTGVIACKAGVLPWTESQIIKSVKSAYTAWHNRVNVVSDIDRGVVAVRDFILAQESRFQVRPDAVPHNRVGWLRYGKYHFTSDGFKEACGGVDATKVKKALRNLGLLHTNRTGRLNASITHGGRTVNTTAIDSEILSDSLKNTAVAGVGGVKSIATGATGNATTGKELALTAVDMDARHTSNATTESQPPLPGNRINKGATPPTPQTPPKNSELNSVALQKREQKEQTAKTKVEVIL